MSTDTLRHYERVGVLSAHRSEDGYREYSLDAIERLRLIRSALAVEFTLSELGRIFEVRNRGGAPCHQVRDLAAGKLAHMEAMLRDMMAVRNRLRALIKDWDLRLKKQKSGEPARLLETLATPDGSIRFDQKNGINGRKR